jgi:hypothetical protein
MIAGILIARSAIKFIVSKESSIFLRMSAWQRKQCMSYCKSHVGLPRMTPFQSPQVAAHFDRYPAVAKKKMLALRELVFAVAAQTPAIGALQETLKWGEPAYLTPQTHSGSTVRMDGSRKRQSNLRSISIATPAWWIPSKACFRRILNMKETAQ